MSLYKDSIITPAKNLMFFLHGLGSDASDLFPISEYFADAMPNTAFISLNGIENCDLFPYGFQWFSLTHRDDVTIKSELYRVKEQVESKINQKAIELNIPQENIILFGFSQGAMMSLFLSFTASKPYKAVIASSGRLFLPDIPQINDEFTKDLGLKNTLHNLAENSHSKSTSILDKFTQHDNIPNFLTPICLLHGDMDHVVEHKHSIEAHEILKKFGIKTALHISKNLQHSVDLEGINFATRFVQNLS